MNTIFLVTGETPKHVQFAGQWFANRTANVYADASQVGNAIPEMPVAVLAEDGAKGVVPKLRELSKAKIVHVHLGPEVVRKAQGSDGFYHIECPKGLKDTKDVNFLMRLEGMWRKEKSLGRQPNGRPAIRVPRAS